MDALSRWRCRKSEHVGQCSANATGLNRFVLCRSRSTPPRGSRWLRRGRCGRPVSPVLAFTLTRRSGTPSSSARFARIAAFTGPSFGSWAKMVTSRLTIRQPSWFSRVERFAQEEPRVGVLPLRVGVRVGVADVAQCRGTEQGVGDGVQHHIGVRMAGQPARVLDRTPPRISGRPSTSRWVSCPVPTRTTRFPSAAEPAGILLLKPETAQRGLYASCPEINPCIGLRIVGRECVEFLNAGCQNRGVWSVLMGERRAHGS